MFGLAGYQQRPVVHVRTLAVKRQLHQICVAIAFAIDIHAGEFLFVESNLRIARQQRLAFERRFGGGVFRAFDAEFFTKRFRVGRMNLDSLPPDSGAKNLVGRG